MILAVKEGLNCTEEFRKKVDYCKITLEYMCIHEAENCS